MRILCPNRVSRHDWIIAVSLGCFVSLRTSLFRTNWYHMMPQVVYFFWDTVYFHETNQSATTQCQNFNIRIVRMKNKVTNGIIQAIQQHKQKPQTAGSKSWPSVKILYSFENRRRVEVSCSCHLFALINNALQILSIRCHLIVQHLHRETQSLTVRYQLSATISTVVYLTTLNITIVRIICFSWNLQ